MRKLKNIWMRVPRWLRSILDLLASALFVFLFYAAIGAPAITTTQAFRRAEKIHMVGPSVIVDTLDQSTYSEFKTMLVGETGEGIVFFGQYEATQNNGWSERTVLEPVFSYREKTGDLTVLAAPTVSLGFPWIEYGGASLPIYLFDAYPEAIRAELDLTVSGTYGIDINGGEYTQDFTRSYSLEAQREKEGFFRFFISLPTGNAVDAYALELISALSTGSTPFTYPSSHEAAISIPVTVRLYDETDALILERQLTILSPAAAAHAEQGEPMT